MSAATCWNRSVFATKSVSQLSSTSTPALVPSSAAVTRPLAAVRLGPLADVLGALDAQRLDRGVEVAVGLDQGVLAVHHARAGQVAEPLHVSGGVVRHVLISRSLNAVQRAARRAQVAADPRAGTVRPTRRWPASGRSLAARRWRLGVGRAGSAAAQPRLGHGVRLGARAARWRGLGARLARRRCLRRPQPARLGAAGSAVAAASRVVADTVAAGAAAAGRRRPRPVPSAAAPFAAAAASALPSSSSRSHSASGSAAPSCAVRPAASPRRRPRPPGRSGRRPPRRRPPWSAARRCGSRRRYPGSGS